MYTKALQALTFIKDVEKLKNTTRHSWTSNGRHESIPEHTWRAALFAFVLSDEFPNIDINKVIKMFLIHDLGEIYDGDVAAFMKGSSDKEAERQAMKKIVSSLDTHKQEEILSLWEEYEKTETPESKLCRALDKLEALIQHNDADVSTWSSNEHDFQLTYGKKYIDFHPALEAIRKVVDDDSRTKTKEAIERGLHS